MEKDSEQLQIDRSAAETMLLVLSTEPNTSNAVDDVIVPNLIDTNK